jgi:2-polyprenyl-3-methyl-5-hydroxy-6-metoxy-1,4-benzoquinol methylase
MTTTSDSLDPKEIDARLGEVEPDSARDIFLDLLTGEVAPALGLARLLLALGSVRDAEDLVAHVARRWGRPLDPALAEMARLLHDYREGCEGVATMLREHPDPAEVFSSPEESIDACRRFFDRSVTRNEVASVAAYSLGDNDLLAVATREIVDLFERWGFLGRDRRTLEIGCGIGRMQGALSPRVAEAVGIDLSPKMIAAARRRNEGLPNVRFAVSSGVDLTGFEAESFDLVFAVDSFPYIHQAGPSVVEAHFQEAARVLRPGGDFVLLNYSYRDNLAADRAEFQKRCRALGFTLAVNGAQPFRFWDGVAFHGRLS